MPQISKTNSVLANGLTFAKLSSMAYADHTTVPTHVDDREDFACEGGGFACRIDDNAVLVFRGSHSISDWLIDLDADMQKQPVGWVHHGFQKTFDVRLDAYLDALGAIFQRGQVNQLWITGHSLGGALATIMGDKLKEWNPILYTFGSPRVYDVFAASKYDVIHYRFTNFCDPITHVPSWSWFKFYKHVGKRIELPCRCHCRHAREMLVTLLRNTMLLDIPEHLMRTYIHNLSDVHGS